MTIDMGFVHHLFHLPPNIEVVGSWNSPHGIGVLLRSNTFEEVPEGADPPLVEPHIECTEPEWAWTFPDYEPKCDS